MRIRIDRRAWPAALVLLLVALGLLPLSRRASALAFLVLAGHVAFFRDPLRHAPAGDLPVSPADGRVVEVVSVFDSRYLKEEAHKVGIFLSVFVPHVNRAPIEGEVSYLQYEPGKFLNALRKDSVNKNEANWIGIEQVGKRVLVRQIAGAIARRICCDVKLQQQVGRGEKVGIICYGSRVECFFPKRFFTPSVRVGDWVKAGETILGRWLS